MSSNAALKTLLIVSSLSSTLIYNPAFADRIYCGYKGKIFHRGNCTPQELKGKPFCKNSVTKKFLHWGHCKAVEEATISCNCGDKIMHWGNCNPSDKIRCPD